ncbi:MAG: HlyC/CorC family transporter [Phycisphaerae bacterium]|nr:HlyC/CorC family transporter [Phycisphaerae bacterium]
MATALTICGTILVLAITFAFSTVSYALRDYSRVKLAAAFEQANKTRLLQRVLDQTSDLIFVTATGRVVANLAIFVGMQRTFRLLGWGETLQDLLAIVITGVTTIFFSVAFPHALAEHAAERIIVFAARPLLAWRLALLPIAMLMHSIDDMVRQIIRGPQTTQTEQMEEDIQQDILSAVEEGAAEGVVDEQERAIIKSAITFVDTPVTDVMTSRADIIGLPVDATLEVARHTIERSGHGRLPVFEASLDKIVGLLYARDLLQFLGDSPQFDVRAVMRPAWFVPETKSLGALLEEFRDRDAPFAVVLDEYGGTAGVVTIEDLLEQLLGRISDENEPHGSELLTRLDAQTAEADARIYLDQLNRIMKLDLPEDAGYDTLGGFVSTTLGKIPARGTSFNYGRAKFTVLDAEPQRVNRVKIELAPTSRSTV